MSEPERPIEKELRTYAEKRREQAGAPLELHPATRRLLQGEVVRRFGQRPRRPRSFFDLLAGLWPRALWVRAVLGVVVILTAILIPALNKSNPTRVAKNESRMLTPTETAIGTAPATAPESDSIALNAPAGEVQKLTDKNSAGDREQSLLSLNAPWQDAEKDKP